MPILLLAILALLLIGLVGVQWRWARVFGLILAIPLGVLTYFVLGVLIARFIGVGRFYSVPLGAEHIGDSDVLVSLGFWICCWAVLIHRYLKWRAGTA